MTPSRFRWGILLILIGVLLLLVNFKVVDKLFWLDLAELLPYFLIALGVEKIFTNTRFQAISYLSTLALAAGVVYASINSDGHSSLRSAFDDQETVVTNSGDVHRLRAMLDFAHENVVVGGSRGNLIYSYVGAGRTKPKYEYNVTNGEMEAVVTSYGSRKYGPFIIMSGDNREEWQLSFSEEVPLALTCSADNSDLQFEMADIKLESLTVRADRSDIYLSVGEQEPTIFLKLNGRDTRYELRVPSGSGLRVVGFDDRGYFEEIGLMPENGAYVNRLYDQAKSKIDVDLDEDISSLVIETY